MAIAVSMNAKGKLAEVKAAIPIRVNNEGKVLAYTSPSKIAIWRDKCRKAEEEGKPLPPEPTVDTSVAHHTEIIPVMVNGVERLMRAAVTLSLVSESSTARESAI